MAFGRRSGVAWTGSAGPARAAWSGRPDLFYFFSIFLFLLIISFITFAF
jgi:hypothetical protein